MKEKDVRDIIDIFMKYEFSAHENESAIINSQNKRVKQNCSFKNDKPTFKNNILLL